MRFRELSGPVLFAALSMVGGAAMAQEPPPAAPPPGMAEPPAAAPPAAAPPAAAMEGGGAAAASKMRLGLNVVPMPFGTIKVSGLGASSSESTKFAFGAFPFFDFLFTPNLFGGIAVQYTFNVNIKNGATDAAKELDIMLRLGGGGYVADKLQLYGYASPGYSIVMPPSGYSGPDPKGFVVGLHAGAMFDVTPGAFLNLEIGYQLGFQSASQNGFTADFKTNFGQVGLGGGIRF